MGNYVKDTDLGWKDLKKELKDFDGKVVKVGVLETAGKSKKGNATMAQIATWNEYGTEINVTNKMRGFFHHNFGVNLKKSKITIPSRPFMRQSFDDNKGRIKQNIDILRDSILSGKRKGQQAITTLGGWYKGVIQDKISNGRFVKNADLTLLLKKSSRPLINTDQLRQSINFEVED